MITGGRFTPAGRTVAGAALVLLVLGAYWPGVLPGAQIAVDVLLVSAGALLAHALVVERSRPLGETLAGGLRLLVPPLLALVTIGIAVQRWWDVRVWMPVLDEVRHAAHATINLQTAGPESPVTWFWVVALLTQSAAALLVLRFVASALGDRIVAVLVAVLCAGSFAWWLEQGGLATGRFWPVGVGALIALLTARRGTPRGPVAAALAWVASAAVAFAAVTGADPDVLVLGGVAAGAALTLLGPAAGSPARLLPERISRWLAWVAWATFCFAWPALRLAPEIVGHDLGLRDRVLLLAAVVGVAVLVEALVHGLTLVVGRRWVLWPVLVAAAVVAAVAVTMPGIDRVEAIEADVQRVEARLLADQPRCFGASAMLARIDDRTCDNPALEGTVSPDVEEAATDFEAFADCYSRPHEAHLKVCDLGGSDELPRILVLGDSHARVLLSGFRRLARQDVVSVDAAVKASCAWSSLPIRDATDPMRPPLCDRWRANLADWLEEHATDYDVIVTTAYNGRMTGPEDERVRGLVDVWTPVARAGVPIVALEDNPRMEEDTIVCLEDADPDELSDCDVPKADVVPQPDPFEPAAEQVEGAHFVDTGPFFCRAKVCPAVIGGVNVYRDYNHVSATYAESLAPLLYREIALTGVFEPRRTAAGTAASVSD